MKHKEHYLSIAVIAFSLMISLGIINAATAQNVSNVQYPVEELGNCKNKAACKAYCDAADHMQACIAFAKKNKLMSTREIETAEKFIAAGSKGPGGCLGKDECESFCDDMAHINECVAFAEKNGLMPQQELEEAKKIQSAIQRGVKPPACKNKKSCDLYCSQADHMEECMAFAEAAGFMKEEELTEAKKVLSAIKSGVKPPACRGKEECDAYCGEEGHFEECIAFAEAAGFMKPEEVQMARKTGGKGPGGCRGKDECDAFCGDPANQQACFAFAKEHGLMKEEDLQRMEEGKEQMMRGFEQAPQEVRECLNASLGSDFVEKVKSGAVMPSMDIGEKMQACFEKMRPQEGQMQQGEFRQEEFRGQEGELRKEMIEGQTPRPMMNSNQIPQEVVQCIKAKTGTDIAEQMRSGQFRPGGEMEEAMKGCFEAYGQKASQQRPPEGVQMMPKEGQVIPAIKGAGKGMLPQQIPQGGTMKGPGGCTSPEECRAYCQAHPQECGGSAPMQAPMPQPGMEGQQMPPEGYKTYPTESQMPPAGYQQMQPVPDYQMTPPPADGTYVPPTEVKTESVSGKVMPLLNRMVHGFYRLVGIE